MRISTTTLEAFRRFRDGLSDEAALLATITGTFVPTRRVIIGRAYDQILTDPERWRVPGGYASDGVAFEAQAVEPALATIDRRGLVQVKHTRAYGPHTVVAKLDYIRGLRIVEFKTRIGGFSPDGYARSYQWRFQLAVFAATAVTYRVFCLTEGLALRAIEEVTLYPYPQLAADGAALVEGFVAYVVARGLEAYLPDDAGMRGPRFEDAPTRPSAAPRLRALRAEVRARRAVLDDQALPIAPTVLPDLEPLVVLPDPMFTLRPPNPRQPRQVLLF